MSTPPPDSARFTTRQTVGLVLGPLILLVTLIAPPPGDFTPQAWAACGLALLMATWWICETLPIPATALLPLALGPMLGLGSAQETSTPFANPLIFLFLGGFLIALGMQKSRLHERLALMLLSKVGTKPPALSLGFMVACGFLSMWVSNTATAMMMYPIALSVLELLRRKETAHWSERDQQALGICLLLAVAYGSSIGGLGTLIGTPPNALLAAFMNEQYGRTIGFAEWMLVGLPLVALGLPLAHLILTRLVWKLPRHPLPGVHEELKNRLTALGPWSKAEIRVAMIFGCTALAWMFQPVLAQAIPALTDSVIAITGALLLFLVPSDIRRGEFLMDWETAKNLPWGVLLLFGGGLSLAGIIQRSGLAEVLGAAAAQLEGLPVWFLILVIAGLILVLTEMTSNTATAATFLPVVAAIALGMGQDPLLFAAPAALAASCAFMLPVGTPPNAVVFASGRVSLPQMAVSGVWVNVLFVLLVSFLGPLLVSWVFLH